MLVYITDTASAFAERLAGVFRERGFEVITGAALDSASAPIDVFIATEDGKTDADTFTVLNSVDPEVIMDAVSRHVSGPIKKLETALPHMERGALKRVCFLSGHTASINMTRDVSGYGYNMSKAALHQALRIIKNRLVRDGYGVRLFDPLQHGEDERVTLENAAQAAASYFLTIRAYDPDNKAGRDDEHRLALRDALGREWPW